MEVIVKVTVVTYRNSLGVESIFAVYEDFQHALKDIEDLTGERAFMEFGPIRRATIHAAGGVYSFVEVDVRRRPSPEDSLPPAA